MAIDPLILNLLPIGTRLIAMPDRGSDSGWDLSMAGRSYLMELVYIDGNLRLKVVEGVRPATTAIKGMIFSIDRFKILEVLGPKPS